MTTITADFQLLVALHHQQLFLLAQSRRPDVSPQAQRLLYDENEAVGHAGVQLGRHTLVEQPVPLAKLLRQIEGLIALQPLQLGRQQVRLVPHHYRHQVSVLAALHLFVQLLQLHDRVRAGEVVDVENSIEEPQLSLLDVLRHAVAAGVPDCEIDEEVVVDANLLEPELKSVGGRDVLGEALLLAGAIVTSMQLSSDDLPTSPTPTSAIFTFSSLRCEKERSLSVSIEYDDPLNILYIATYIKPSLQRVANSQYPLELAEVDQSLLAAILHYARHVPPQLLSNLG